MLNSHQQKGFCLRGTLGAEGRTDNRERVEGYDKPHPSSFYAQDFESEKSKRGAAEGTVSEEEMDL